MLVDTFSKRRGHGRVGFCFSWAARPAGDRIYAGLEIVMNGLNQPGTTRVSRGVRATGVTVTAVIPAMNEAANLPHVFARIPSCVTEIVLVDGNSSDDTIEVARALRPDVRVVLQNGRGKGNALACGFAAAHGDIIVMLDADGSTDPAEIPKFIAPLLAGADFAKGSRYAAGGGSADITRIRDTGNHVLGGAVNLLFGTKFTDLCYGYNAFWRSCLPHMHVTCDGFEVETLINVRVARAGLRVTEVPSYEQARIHGESNLHAIRDGRRVLSTILRERFSRRVTPSDSWRPEYRELGFDSGAHRVARAS
jgi:glycosyltransferase involved in cell wall biosynthesis